MHTYYEKTTSPILGFESVAPPRSIARGINRYELRRPSFRASLVFVLEKSFLLSGYRGNEPGRNKESCKTVGFGEYVKEVRNIHIEIKKSGQCHSEFSRQRRAYLLKLKEIWPL